MATDNTYDNVTIETVCFTGHREIEAPASYLIPQKLKDVIRKLAAHGARRFLAGGAMGFDTVAALCVLELKKELPDISLELILPCRDQARTWNDRNRDLYNAILSYADRVEYLHDRYTSSCMHDRNRRLVDLCDVCVSYCIHSGGGSAYTMSYALSQGKEVINIADLIDESEEL